MQVDAVFEGGKFPGVEMSVTLVDGEPPQRVGDHVLRDLTAAAILARGGELTRGRHYDYSPRRGGRRYTKG